MSKTTKEDILIVALHLFARDGYEAVSVSQIAGELGMTKGALYRHYESKRDIFDHIVKRMEQGDGEQAESHDMMDAGLVKNQSVFQKAYGKFIFRPFFQKIQSSNSQEPHQPCTPIHCESCHPIRTIHAL